MARPHKPFYLYTKKNLEKSKKYPKMVRPLQNFELPIPEHMLEPPNVLSPERMLAAVFLHHILLDLRPVRKRHEKCHYNSTYKENLDNRNQLSAIKWLDQAPSDDCMSLDLVASLLGVTPERIRKAASLVLSGSVQYSYSNLRF